MKISLNWIKDYVDLDGINVKDLCNRFTVSTAEIEDAVQMGGDIRNVVVGKVMGVEPHPSSRKLKICRVDIGNTVVQCLCGAPNVEEGMYAPFAKAGGAFKKVPLVEAKEIAGVESLGVLCSAAELGISDNHEGLLSLPEYVTPGTDIKSIVDIDDIIIEIDNKSLTNRPDLWGHYGIARELAAIFKRRLKPMDLAENVIDKSLAEIDIRVEDTEKCFRYTGLAIEGIRVKESPLNMQVRLYYCGIRPISPIVDLTNYLMLETGQPMHAFDRRYMNSVVVKSTDAPAAFTTLDGSMRIIPSDVLFICSGEKPVAIAGIMGGENSEVSEDTTAILLESANFEGSSIRKASSRIGLRTEASARFEKMLDPELTVISVKRFVQLLRSMQPDIRLASNMTDVYARRYEPVEITVTKPYIDKYVGSEISAETVASILEALEFKVGQESDAFVINVPSFRATKDITIKADIVEEISRIYGYDNIMPKAVELTLKPPEVNEERTAEHRTRDILAEKFGLNEVHSHIWYNSTFNSKIGIGQSGRVTLLNPNARDMNILRDSLAPIMLEFAEANCRSYNEISIFEIGSVFNAADAKSRCMEHKSLCVLLSSKTKSEDRLFYELKGIASALLGLLKNIELEFAAPAEIQKPAWVHPVKTVELKQNGNSLGYITVVHPQICRNIDKKLNMAVLEINMSEVYLTPGKQVEYAEPSRYPEVMLDFSFLADRSAAFDSIKAEISGFRSDSLLRFEFVDVYSGKGLPENKKSMTFRFIIGSREKTLSSEDINEFSGSLLKFMESKGYSLR